MLLALIVSWCILSYILLLFMSIGVWLEAWLEDRSNLSDPLKYLYAKLDDLETKEEFSTKIKYSILAFLPGVYLGYLVYNIFYIFKKKYKELI